MPKMPAYHQLISRVRGSHRTPPEGAPSVDARTSAVFVLTTILLVVFQYFGKPDAYRQNWINDAMSPIMGAAFGEHASIAPYAWWALTSLVLRVLVPFAIIAFVFREPLAEYGWRWKGQLRNVPAYAGLYLLMLPLILWAASMESFQLKYPFYKDAAAGGPLFWMYEALYGVQFLGVEVFFRGFLTFALFRRFGYNALFIMTIPYVMVHFNKPLPEVFGALGAGLMLGYMALRSGSCVLGIFLHWSVGITMDVLAIGKNAGGLGAALRAIF